MKLISLVFSFRNEEKNLEELVNRVTTALQKVNNYSYELIFVNDSSEDSSERILENLQKKFPIKIINMTRNFGIAPCVLAGFRESKGDCIILWIRFTRSTELIPELVKKYEEGNDIVHTKRTKRLGESKIKLLLTRLAYLIIHYFSDINLPIEAGDYKLISRRAMDIF